MMIFRALCVVPGIFLIGCVDDPRDENPPQSLHENICLSLRLGENTVELKKDAPVGLELLPTGQVVEFSWFDADDVMALGTFKATRDGEVVLAQIDSRPSRNLARFADASGTPGGGIAEDVRCEGFAEDPQVLAFRRQVQKDQTYYVRFDGQSEFGVSFYIDYADNWSTWNN